MEKKILVAIDGSIYSVNSLRYLAQLFEKLTDVKLHLISFTTISASQSAKGLLSEEELMENASSADKGKSSKCKAYLNEAIIQLARHGFPPDQVTTEVKLSRSSIANDILHEAKKGMYDALVIGRRGIGKLEELILGSVSTSVLEKNINVPVWIIDGRVNSRKFLVPVDGSQSCLHAVDHLSHLLKNNPYAEITLFHSKAMLANVKEIAPHECKTKFGEEWCDMHTSGDDSLFHAPEQILLESGFPADRINHLTTTKGMYPSRQIVRQALLDEFGTIVMGKSSKFKKGFFKNTLEQVIAMAIDVSLLITD